MDKQVMDEAAEVTARLTQVRCQLVPSAEADAALRRRLSILAKADPERSSKDVAECAGVLSVVTYYLGHEVTNRVLEPVKRVLVEARGSQVALRASLQAMPGIGVEKLTPQLLGELTDSLLKAKGGG